MILGLIPFTQNSLFHDPLSPLRPLGSSIGFVHFLFLLFSSSFFIFIETAGAPAVPLLIMILAAVLVDEEDDDKNKKKEKKNQRIKKGDNINKNNRFSWSFNSFSFGGDEEDQRRKGEGGEGDQDDFINDIISFEEEKEKKEEEKKSINHQKLDNDKEIEDIFNQQITKEDEQQDQKQESQFTKYLSSLTNCFLYPISKLSSLSLPTWSEFRNDYLPLFLFIFIRLFLIPALFIPLFGTFYQSEKQNTNHLIFGSPIILLIFMLVSAMPSAVLGFLIFILLFKSIFGGLRN